MNVTSYESNTYALERGLACAYAWLAMPRIGANIKALCESAEPRIEIADIAAALGVKYQTVHDALNRSKDFGVGKLLKYAVVLKSPIERLVVGVNRDYDALWRDTPRHTPELKTPVSSQKAGADAGSQAEARVLRARIIELEGEVAGLQRVLSEVAARSTRAMQAGRKTGSTADSRAGRRGRH